MTITDEVFALDCTAGAYAYAVRTGEGVTLIDTGMPFRGGKILAELGRQGIAPGDIRQIILTHTDIDHVGGAGAICGQAGSKVYMSAAELELVRGEKKRSGAKRLLGGLIRTLLPECEPVPDGGLPCFEIISTPGHTAGHICIKYKNVLFLGDLVQTSRDMSGLAHLSKGYIADIDMAEDSCLELDMAGVDWLCPAHGRPVPMGRLWEDFIREIPRLRAAREKKKTSWRREDV